MILTVTPNACVDKTYQVEGFLLDRVNRPNRSYTLAGGKGINVARVYQTLGGEALCTGFVAGINGEIISRALKSEGISDEFISIPGESRTCIAIIDSDTGTQTEINETGPEVYESGVQELCEKFESLLRHQRYEFVVLSGSLPPGCPVDLYAKLILLCRDFGIRCVLDSSGEPLNIGAAARPWMLKPNRFEMETLTGESVPDMDASSTLIGRLGLSVDQVMVVTFGADGALMRCGNREWRGSPPPIKFASAVASGDAFLAAFLWAWESGAEDALRMGLGAGAANAAVIGAGFCSRDSILECAAGANIEPKVVFDEPRMNRR